MRDTYLRGALLSTVTPAQMKALAAYVASGGSESEAARRVGSRPSTVKRHRADLRARSGLTTEQLICAGRAAGWLVVPNLEPRRKLNGPVADITCVDSQRILSGGSAGVALPRGPHGRREG